MTRSYNEFFSSKPAFLSEEIVFPVLNERLDFSGEIAEHKAIHDALDDIITYIKTVSSKPATFDPTNLKDKMTRLRDPLVCSLIQLDE